jgi:hypothetical protein
VEKKVKELKIANASKPTEQTFAKATEIDWAHRYTSQTGGRYGKIEPRYEAKVWWSSHPGQKCETNTVTLHQFRMKNYQPLTPETRRSLSVVDRQSENRTIGMSEPKGG